MRKILTKPNKEGKKKTVAINHGENVIEIKRGDQVFKIVGKDFSVISTAPNDPQERVAFTVEDGKLVLDGIDVEEVKKDDKGEGDDKDDKKEDDKE